VRIANISFFVLTGFFHYDDKPVSQLKELGFDIQSFYTNRSQELPIPAVFIIDQDQKVICAKPGGGDYEHRVEINEIIKALEEHH